MKRPITFKAIESESGNWIEGDLSQDVITGKVYISRQDGYPPTWNDPGGCDIYICKEVIPSSICEYTGRQTQRMKKGQDARVFEGDLFREEKENFQGNEYTQINVVMWIKQRACFYMVPIEHYDVLNDQDCEEWPDFSWLFDDALLYDFALDSGLCKIGNIHDKKTDK